MKGIKNTKIGKTNFFRYNKKFTIKELKKILKQLDNDTLIEFGVYDKKNNCNVFTQEDGIIFRLNYKDLNDKYDGKYTMEIITNYDLDFFKK